MILDKMENYALYTSCHKDFDLAFGMLEEAVKDDLPVGKYELGNTQRNVALVVSVQEYETKPREERKFEGHKQHIDIQYIVSGEEEMEVCDLSRMVPVTDYDAEKDCRFFAPAKQTTRLTLQAGDYAIFFPDDIHKPGISPAGKVTAVKKIVVKIEV